MNHIKMLRKKIDGDKMSYPYYVPRAVLENDICQIFRVKISSGSVDVALEFHDALRKEVWADSNMINNAIHHCLCSLLRDGTPEKLNYFMDFFDKIENWFEFSGATLSGQDIIINAAQKSSSWKWLESNNVRLLKNVIDIQDIKKAITEIALTYTDGLSQSKQKALKKSVIEMMKLMQRQGEAWLPGHNVLNWLASDRKSISLVQSLFPKSSIVRAAHALSLILDFEYQYLNLNDTRVADFVKIILPTSVLIEKDVLPNKSRLLIELKHEDQIEKFRKKIRYCKKLDRRKAINMGNPDGTKFVITAIEWVREVNQKNFEMLIKGYEKAMATNCGFGNEVEVKNKLNGDFKNTLSASNKLKSIIEIEILNAMVTPTKSTLVKSL